MILHRRLLAMAGRLRGPLLLVVAVGLAATAASVAQAVLVAAVLAAVFAGTGWTALAPTLVGLAAVVAARGLLAWLREVVAQWAGELVRRRLRLRLFDRLLALGPAHLHGARTGQVQAALVDGVDGLDGYYGRYLPQVVIALVTAAGLIGWLATTDAAVAAVLGVAVLAVPLVPQLWDRALGERGSAHWAAYERLGAEHVDTVQGLTTLKSFGAAQRHRDRLRADTWDLYRATMAQLAVSLVGTGLSTLLVAVGTAAAVAVAVLRFATGALTPFELLLVLLLAGECFRPFAALAGYWHLSYLGISAADDVGALLTAEPAVAAPATALPLPVGPLAVSLRGVGFRYPGADRPALRGVDLDIAPGETVAVVGRSGAGKTTLATLLARFHDPDAGTVRLGGVDLRRLDPARLRAALAVVPQDPYLFTGTIADNIRLGRPDATDAQVRAAGAAAGLDDVVATGSAGYDSPVGERGLTLSGGQRQRIAIARALLRDAPVLVLDEATSAVDARREGDIQRALRRLCAGRTVLVIAHRLSTVRDADRIVVLDDGAVVQSGPPDALLAAAGPYRRLVAAQVGAR
ncbi:ABC transporter ATP-binding protein/permease [Pseudonocardia humida]|uniref:ABC transporter ATP-binding protein n=1 Tax=Pseudonocardia humida TaxID=2800819 RepID=A0ABT0ZWM2_9PSEU|nr:ATP-binding cassette domain-containing protein [Pseudonocardia humida]MCO1655149.1 ABC transporter ATP-binding protein [Pseudonocardia humida]